MNVAKQALGNNNFGHAVKMLDRQRPGPGQTDLRGWEWRYLWDQTRSDALFTLCQESNEVHSLSVSSDGKLVAATVYGRGGLSLWNVEEHREVFRTAQTEQNVCAAFSPTEPLLAFSSISFESSGRQRSLLRILNSVSRQVISETPLDGECVSLAISTDGQTLATITWGDRTKYQVGGQITLWRLPEAKQRASYACEPAHWAGASFAVTPYRSVAAYVMSGQGLRIIDLEDGRELWNKDGRELWNKDGRELWNKVSDAKCVAFSPDGRLLAAGVGADIVLWDAATGKEIDRLAANRSSVTSLLFWPDGKKLASGSADQTIRIWEVPTGTCVDTLRGHRQQVVALALMPDNRTLVSGCRDGTVCLWDTSVSHPRRPRIEIPTSALRWAFESDSQSVVTLNEHGRITRWKGANFEIAEPVLETGERPHPYAWCFSSDGSRLVRCGDDGAVRVWDIPSRTLWRQFTKFPGHVRKVFAHGNRVLILSLVDFAVRDVDLMTGSEIQSWQAPADIIHFCAFTGRTVLRDSGIIWRRCATYRFDRKGHHKTQPRYPAVS